MIDPHAFGVSFSIKQCRNFGLNSQQTLQWLIEEAGFRRFRLMSYWNEHEKQPGVYDFSELDWQVDMISKAGGHISLCLGARQPRWPENHWPEWAWKLSKEARSKALLTYIEQVISRYKIHTGIVSYQLENEALLKQFGERSEVDRARLRDEFNLSKQLDSSRPILMSTSTSWGIPLRRPIPDMVGFSFYRILYNNGKYGRAFHFPRVDQLRALTAKLLLNRPSIIHELQLEPWGPKAIWKMPIAEQDKSMSIVHIRKNIQLARKTHLYPIDLWGGEWWYWRLKAHQDSTIWQEIEKLLKQK